MRKNFHGHLDEHFRRMFLQAIEASRNWAPGQPEPTVTFEDDGESARSSNSFADMAATFLRRIIDRINQDLRVGRGVRRKELSGATR